MPPAAMTPAPRPASGGARGSVTILRRVTALTLGLVAIGVALAAALPAGQLHPLAWLLLAGGVIVAELRPVTVGRGTQHQNFTLIEGPVVMALALQPGLHMVLAIALGIALAQAYRRIVPYKLVFNVSLFTVASASGAVCAHLLPGLEGVLVGILVFTAVNELCMRLILWLATGSRFGYAWQRADLVRLLHVAAVISVGLLAAATWASDPHLLPAFLGPIALLQWSQEQANRKRAQGSIARALADQATTLYGRSSMESALLILRSARELLTCARAEIVLLGPEGALLLRDAEGSRPDDNAKRIDPATLLDGWSGTVLETVTAVTQDRWAGVVIGKTEPTALLAVWRGDDQDVFRDIDRQLLQQLADDVQRWFVADPDTSDIVASARLRAAEMGGRYEQVATALGDVVRVHQGLLAGTAADPEAGLRLAHDLHLAAETMAGFVSDLLALPEQPQGGGDVVQTGSWRGTATG